MRRVEAAVAPTLFVTAVNVVVWPFCARWRWRGHVLELKTLTGTGGGVYGHRSVRRGLSCPRQSGAQVTSPVNRWTVGNR